MSALILSSLSVHSFTRKSNFAAFSLPSADPVTASCMSTTPILHWAKPMPLNASRPARIAVAFTNCFITLPLQVGYCPNNPHIVCQDSGRLGISDSNHGETLPQTASFLKVVSHLQQKCFLKMI